ncbi:hypothetical protein LCGC14_1433290 [marine sediment metagenome]|uniref:Uncharacterized protein n=1 Tax=marine sediment metagenome TaxID=412755 RepID=A0A0F9K946_9ZZZZ
MKRIIIFAILILALVAVPAMAAKQVYVFYETADPFPGYIRFTGRVDMSQVSDGSTLKERLAALLTEYSSSAYYLFPLGTPVDPETQKFDAATSSLVPLDPGDITPTMAQETKHNDATAELTLNDLAGKSYADVETWIDTQVTDMASARAVLKKMAKIILAMLKKGDWSD